MKGDEIVWHCDRHSNETVTPRKHVTTYENMLNWMVEFPRRSENRGIKFAGVNSIRITKSINLPIFCTVLGVSCDIDVFKLTASAQSFNREVYGQ